MAPRRPGTKSKWECFCRQGIQEAVVRLISREGATALTMDRVAAEAGVAKGTLYVYYKDKQQLLESVKDASMQPMRDELFAILEGVLPPDQKIRRFIGRHLGYLDANRDFFRVLLWDRQIATAHRMRHQSARYRAYVESIARVLEEGMRLGLFRRVEPLKVAVILMEGDMAMIAQRLWTDEPGPVEEDAELLYDMFTRGLAAGATLPANPPWTVPRKNKPAAARTPEVRTTRRSGARTPAQRKDRTP